MTVKRRGILYLSIPYERGWSVYVDGKKTSTVKVFDAMLGAELAPGEHEVELRYFPDGLDKGLVISGAAAVIFILLLISKKKKKKRRSSAVSAPEEAPDETEDNE